MYGLLFTGPGLLPGTGNQAAIRFLIISYFYCLLIVRSEEAPGTYGVARRQVADGRRADGCPYMRVRIYIYKCTSVCPCIG